MTRSRPAPCRRAPFDELVADAFDDVWRFVRRRVADAADADDVTAEVFATAWRRRESWPPEAERRLWLFGVARNTLANHHRSGRRREATVLRLVAQPRPDEGRDDPARRDDSVTRALAALPAAERDLLVMRAWDGLAVSEIATLLDITANAASQRLARARDRLAAELAATDPDRAGHGGDEPDRRGPGANEEDDDA